jgi:hypothetical protein
MTIKSRKVGNSIVLTVPDGFKLPVGIDFEPSIDDHGNLIYKRVSSETLEPADVENIHEFMDRFQPLMEKLKDQ